jgi:hypothetical protein
MPGKNDPQALLRRFSQCPQEPYSGSTKTARSDKHPESNYKKTVYPELNLGGGFTCEFMIRLDGTLIWVWNYFRHSFTKTDPQDLNTG